MARIRHGDDQAAAELVQRYQSIICREVRMHLGDRRLGRLMDSMDISQSVLASFFVRAAVGQYDLERPEQLVRLLVTMARNKVASQARRQHRQRRDVRRIESDGDAVARVASNEETPSDVVASGELLTRFRDSLTHEERQIADLRRDGTAWSEIASLLGGSAQARRMQLSRAIERVCEELGLDPGPDS